MPSHATPADHVTSNRPFDGRQYRVSSTHSSRGVPANARVAAQADRLGVIVDALPASAVISNHPATWALYELMREVVHGGRELEAVDYVVRNRHRVTGGDLSPLDLRGKVVASFATEARDDRTLPVDIIDDLQPEAGPAVTPTSDKDEVAIVLAYHRAATGIRMSDPAEATFATGVCLAVDMMLTPPRHGPVAINPLAALRNCGRASSRGSRLSDQLKDAGVDSLPGRSLGRMLAGTGRSYDRHEHVTSLLYCASTKYEIRSLPAAVVGRWAADSVDLEPPRASDRSRLRRVAWQRAIGHRVVASLPASRNTLNVDHRAANTLLVPDRR